ncbi:hypothetical protein HaLaN_23992 [Haematococcus lacustris]|uniref:Uncharacterized protein n=1 Tax=Haematococcus lacustris TaxID=44745 RepID=A0A6A0A2U8_HAELA|nr:hypothetical protein HaLaN_23992 [Haematococcus lacustris]
MDSAVRNLGEKDVGRLEQMQAKAAERQDKAAAG